VTELLVTTYKFRQVTREQFIKLHFATLAQSERWESSVPGRILRRLTTNDFLDARPFPVARQSGRPPLIYSVGPNAVPVLASALNLSRDAIARRQKQDASLSWLFFAHRQAVNDVRIAFLLACERQGYQLIWYPDEDLALLRETAKVKHRQLPIRPDGFLVVDPSGKAAPCFLEVQLQSEPRQYLQKARAYEAYYRSGAYSNRFRFQALRVLAVTDTPTRAHHLTQTILNAPDIALPQIFWSTSLEQAMTNPFGHIWNVPTYATPAALLAEQKQ
jgi:hypothetical protein